MKRGLASILVGVMTLFLLGCDNDKTYDYELYGLNSKVKSVKVTTYEAEIKFGDIVKGDIESDNNYLAEFNTSGNIEKITMFDDDGDLSLVVNYKYNDDNNLIESICYNHKGDIEYREVNEYDGVYVVKNTTYYTFSDKEQVYVNEIKRNGESILSSLLYENSELKSEMRYSQVDKDGKEWIVYDKDGIKKSRVSESYNDTGRLIKRDNGNYSLEIDWNDENLPIRVVNGMLYLNTMVSSTSYNTDDVFYMEYEYDKKGNWIKQIVYEGEMKKPLTISEREIMY